MKVIFTIAKKQLEKGKIISVETQEIVSEDVSKFELDEATQKIHVFYNQGEPMEIDLMIGDDNYLEQWFLADIKCFQIPLIIK